MKKFLIPIFFLPFLLLSCKSNEEKAATLIKTELSKSLYDFESYSPIETIVTEAKLNEFTDTTVWKRAVILVTTFELAQEEVDKLKDAKEYMDIWGPPSYYSSATSDRKYYKYKEEADKHATLARGYLKAMKALASSLKNSINSLDSSAVVGWEVKHRFRCKTKGGHNTIGDYRYVMSKDFTKIFIQEDCDDERFQKLRDIISSVKNNEFESIDED